MNDQRSATSYNQAVSIKVLADQPHLVPPVGEIRWKEWGHPPEPEDLDWWIDITRREAGRDTLPITWVAISSLGQALGAVGLATFDLIERQDLSPSVVGMIVAPACRNSGIGGQLLTALGTWAQNCGYAHIWVATGGRAVAFYKKYGYRFAEYVERPSGEVLTILKKTL